MASVPMTHKAFKSRRRSNGKGNHQHADGILKCQWPAVRLDLTLTHRVQAANIDLVSFSTHGSESYQLYFQRLRRDEGHPLAILGSIDSEGTRCCYLQLEMLCQWHTASSPMIRSHSRSPAHCGTLPVGGRIKRGVTVRVSLRQHW